MKRFLTALAIFVAFAPAAHAELTSATGPTVNRALHAGKPAVIDLGARTCDTCRKMVPIIESLAKEYRGRAGVLFVDVGVDRAAADRFRIQMIPTQIFFDARGREVKRHIGFLEKAAIARELKGLGVR